MLDDFRDRHKGRQCFVFGAGPSLSRFDCDRIALQGVTICCNAAIMALTSCDYFLFTDPRVVEEPYYPSVFDKAGRIIAGNLEIFSLCVATCPSGARERLELPSPERRDIGNGLGGRFIFSEDPDTLIAGGSVEVATHLAYVMGCSPITLVGVDLCWEGDRKYFHDRSDPSVWPSRGIEDDPAEDYTLAAAFKHWTRIKQENPGLDIFIASEQSRLCELYPPIDLSAFHKGDTSDLSRHPLPQPGAVPPGRR